MFELTNDERESFGSSAAKLATVNAKAAETTRQIVAGWEPLVLSAMGRTKYPLALEKGKSIPKARANVIAGVKVAFVLAYLERDADAAADVHAELGTEGEIDAKLWAAYCKAIKSKFVGRIKYVKSELNKLFDRLGFAERSRAKQQLTAEKLAEFCEKNGIDQAGLIVEAAILFAESHGEDLSDLVNLDAIAAV